MPRATVLTFSSTPLTCCYCCCSLWWWNKTFFCWELTLLFLSLLLQVLLQFLRFKNVYLRCKFMCHFLIYLHLVQSGLFAVVAVVAADVVVVVWHWHIIDSCYCFDLWLSPSLSLSQFFRNAFHQFDSNRMKNTFELTADDTPLQFDRD